jgi:hypothetical protein
VWCFAQEPDCPSGTVPGIKDGCWTGYCIPFPQCGIADCADITHEAMCIDRFDCEAYYVGVNCSCDDSGCTCTDWVFDKCMDATAP